VPDVVMGDPEILNKLGTDAATLVTVPLVAGADQTPSPRQKVEALADVPLFKLVTGRLPVTPVTKDIFVTVLFDPFMVLLVSVSVVALPTNVSVLVGSVNVPVLLMLEIIGVVSVLLVKVSVPANVANVPVVGNVTLVVPVSVLVYAKLPEPVTVIAALFATPVPPLAAANVPATVTAPVVTLDGVRPVVPKLIELTPDPAPENCAQTIAVTPMVPPASDVQTQPVSASVVPCSTNT